MTLIRPAMPAAASEVADVGLDRSDEQGPIRLAAFPKCLRERLHFNRIAKRGAGAVRFDASRSRTARPERARPRFESAAAAPSRSAR